MTNKGVTPVVKNAIDYIEESPLFTNDKYNWIVQLVRSVLDDNLQEDNNVEIIIDNLIGRKRKHKIKSVTVLSKVDVPENIANPKSVIVKIKSIDILKNIGLITLNEPLNFKDGLNVFFGKNGAGKSTLYMGMCRALGHPKRVFPNVNFSGNDSCCVLTYEGVDGKDYKSKWDVSNNPDKPVNVRIFDSLISNFIVQHDQENRFEMAHLKIEYFSKLHDLYDLLEKKLAIEANFIGDKKFECKNSIQLRAPFLFKNNELALDEKNLKTITFLKKDKKELDDIENQIKLLEKGSADSLIKNINGALEEINKLLVRFGNLNPKETSDEKSNVDEWELNFDKKYLDCINKKIKQYQTTKAFIKQQGKNKIASSLPEDWLNNPLWEIFIKSSIEFLNTLDNKSITKFLKEKCVYCNQDLRSDESRKLMEAYQELSHNLKDKLDSIEFELNKIREEVVSIVELFEHISVSNSKIVAELEHIGKDEQMLSSIDFVTLKKDFEGIAGQIQDSKEIIYKNCIPRFNKFWNIYVDIYEALQNKLLSLKDNVLNKAIKLDEYNEKAIPLESKRDTVAIKSEILKYIKLERKHLALSLKIDEISAIRQLTSTIKTTFTNKETLNEFKNTLNDEYKFFDFSMPLLWEIKPITRDGVNKRVYSIGDKQLAEIFSEGEQKVHSLSDFFAQCRMEKYKGVFIFDDPVNSLDEDNIELVANRIKGLVDDGNQVIVFTHNLYFLNSLINTSRDKINKLERNNSQISLMRDLNIDDKKDDMKKRLAKIKEKFESLDKKRPDELDMRNTYDLISGYLESYIEKVLFNNVVSRFRPNIRVESLSSLSPIDSTIVRDLSDLYNRTSRLGSRHSTISMTKRPSYTKLEEDIKIIEGKYKY